MASAPSCAGVFGGFEGLRRRIAARAANGATLFFGLAAHHARNQILLVFAQGGTLRRGATGQHAVYAFGDLKRHQLFQTAMIQRMIGGQGSDQRRMTSF